MKHPVRIEDYLQHIEDAIDRITVYIRELDNVAALECDHKAQAAVIRYIEFMDEAVRIQTRALPGAH